jgi:hypothetical protein
MRRAGLVRSLILVSTVVLAWAALGLGGAAVARLQAGEIATRDYRAQRAADVVDQARTEEARRAAADAVEPVYEASDDIEAQAADGLEALFTAVRDGMLAPGGTSLPPPDPVPGTTAAPAGEGSTTSTLAGETVTAELSGSLFVDVDADGSLGEEVSELGVAEAGLARVTVLVTAADGRVYQTESLGDGSFSLAVPEGPVRVSLDDRDPDFPSGFELSTDADGLATECAAGSTCTVDPAGLTARLRPLDSQIDEVDAEYATLDESTVRTLVLLARGDLFRQAMGLTPKLSKVAEAAATRLAQEFAEGIRSIEQATRARASVVATPPLVFFDEGRDAGAGAAAADVVALFLAQNQFVDQEATERLQDEARQAVPDQSVPFVAGQLIVAADEALTPLHVSAIEETGAAVGRQVREAALAAVLTATVALLAFYLSRFRGAVWGQPRMVALLGAMIVLAAAAVRLTVELQDRSSWYVLPAVAFGYLSAVLFDNRMGVVMALTLGVLTAVGTRDPGASAFAMLAATAPLGFVSKVSSRRAFRNSVVTSSAAVALVAAASAWFFHTQLDEQPWTEIGSAAAWAFGASVVAALLALAVLPFFEAVFDITTTLRLLELTDRNHEALELLQEQAFGTFNHSLMVGTLADAAARRLGANNLLARAAAYYHDIGKTENPQYYIENQFGMLNPHDDLTPVESVEIIRRHVIDGIELARRFRIPSEVAEGIVSHHGDAIMRFFYEKARRLANGADVDPDLFRHAGHKPQSREMVIVMLADSVEGACRAVFGEEEPTPESIAKVVNRVVDEKLADGQLDESDITLGELSRVRASFVDSLIGHYHQRIPYPNFPGT